MLPFARLAGIALPSPLRIAISSDQDRLFADAVAAEMGVDEPPSIWRTRVDAYRRTHLDRGGPDCRKIRRSLRSSTGTKACCAARG